MVIVAPTAPQDHPVGVLRANGGAGDGIGVGAEFLIVTLRDSEGSKVLAYISSP